MWNLIIIIIYFNNKKDFIITLTVYRYYILLSNYKLLCIINLLNFYNNNFKIRSNSIKAKLIDNIKCYINNRLKLNHDNIMI